MPSGPVTQRKAWVEMIHRYLATAVGVLIIVLAASSWLAPRPQTANRLNAPQTRPLASPAGRGLYSNRWWATASLVWVCVQGAFGALTVTMKLFPAIVTLHLLGGLLLLVLLTVQVLRQGLAAAPVLIEPVKPPIKIFIWLAFSALVLQIALGGWVSTNYAVLACNEFPRCQGTWWPLMDFDQGFQIWRQLGLTQHGDHIGFSALTAIHYTHRIMAGVVMLILGALAWHLNAIHGLRLQSRWLAALLGLQLATGLSNVVLDWPLLAALMHTGGAAALILVMTWLAFICGQAPAFTPQRNTAPGARLTELRTKA
jgi:cytochrome c oxidase assembly protein subunit 15